MSVKLFAGVLAGVALVASCGGDDDTPAAPAATAAPALTAAADDTAAPDGTGAPASTGAPVATDVPADRPERVVSLSPTHTEILFAIGAGAQVIAVDEQSNFPAEAEAVRTDLSGFEPNVEAIAGYEPDLVVVEGVTLGERLDDLGIPVWVGPPVATFDEAYAQIEQLGDATGHPAEAAALVEGMQADIDEIAASVPEGDGALSLYHEISADGFSADSSTFVGQVYGLFGLRNIADAADAETGYPQLNAETIIAADPDLIFLADAVCCDQDLASVRARPGWETIAAVADGHVFTMNDDEASRWGPRIVDYARDVAAAVATARAPAGG